MRQYWKSQTYYLLVVRYVFVNGVKFMMHLDVKFVWTYMAECNHLGTMCIHLGGDRNCLSSKPNCPGAECNMPTAN